MFKRTGELRSIWWVPRYVVVMLGINRLCSTLNVLVKPCGNPSLIVIWPEGPFILGVLAWDLIVT
jgi:hypothetical protein